MKTFKPGESPTVRLAEEFELCLQVLGASGYEWQIADKPSGLAMLGSSFKTSADIGIGGASQQTLRLRADAPGTHLLRLVCKRAWDTTPSETLAVQVTVQGRE
jgi:predicted secreted protein